MSEKRSAKVILLAEGGVTGPSDIIPTTAMNAVQDAISWSKAQTGHPWDYLVVDVYDDVDSYMSGEEPSATYQLEHINGTWTQQRS